MSRTPHRASSAPRRRLPAEEAQRRILEAAEQRLTEVGPEGLRLTDLAAQLGISHPAILHHFGSREGLVAAVVRRALDALNQRLVAALTRQSQDSSGSDSVMDLVAQFYSERGQARLIAWLILSGREAPPEPDGGPILRQLAELIHEQRLAAGTAVDFDDTLFRVQLVAIALLGEAIFGDSIRSASGQDSGADASREFRRRLGELLASQD